MANTAVGVTESKQFVTAYVYYVRGNCPSHKENTM